MPKRLPDLTARIGGCHHRPGAQDFGSGRWMRGGGIPVIAAMLLATGLAGAWLMQAVPNAHAESRGHDADRFQSDSGGTGSGQAGRRDASAHDLAILMSQASQYQPAQVRELAQARLQSVPHLAQALAIVLQGPERDQALTYLESNDPVDAPSLAEPVRAAILGMAGDLRDEIRRTRALRGDHFVPQVRRILAAADKFEPYGVDYLPAVRAVREALAEPHPQGGELRCRQVLERWLAKHAKAGMRQAQRLAPALA